MATKQELEIKIQSLESQLSSASQGKNINCSILKANANPDFRNESCKLLAGSILEDPSANTTINLTAAKLYEKFDLEEFRLISQLEDTRNQLKALGFNSSPATRTSPTLPGEASRVAGPNNQRIRIDDSNIPDLPGFERSSVQQKAEDEANRKAGIAVDKTLGQYDARDFDSGEGTPPTNPDLDLTKPDLAPSRWGVKITSVSSTYYMHLLPAISGNLNGTGHMDVPNVMPGLNFKFLSSYAKHKIPGWAPIYQALGIDTVLVTMIGMFTGEDGTDVPTSLNAPMVKGISSPAINTGKFDSFPKQTAALNKVTNSLDTYENLQSFINFGVQKQQTLTIEVNIGKNGEIKPTSKTAGGIRGSNGNPTFSGIIRSLDTYYRRFDRTYYILTMEITKGIGIDCANKPLNLTNKLDEIVKSQMAKLENSCKVGVVEGEKNKTVEEQKQLIDTLKDACYKYGEEGNTQKAFFITSGGEIQTGVFEYGTNDKLIKSTPGQLYTGKEAISFLIDNQSVSNRKGCNINIGSTQDRIKTALSAASITYKTPPPSIDTLTIEGDPVEGSAPFLSNDQYAFTKEGYLVLINTSLTYKRKILSVIEANQGALKLLDNRNIDFNIYLKKFLANPNVIYTKTRDANSVNGLGESRTNNPIGSIPTNSKGSPYGNSSATNKNPYGN